MLVNTKHDIFKIKKCFICSKCVVKHKEMVYNVTNNTKGGG
nr:MAG TPA: hypothetical protein [Caudoviricetes sp.]